MNGSGSLTAQVPSGTPTINIAGSGVNLYFYTSLSGTQGFNKAGSGKLTFRYSNLVQPFSGKISISAGTLGIQGDFSLGNTNNDLTIASGATLVEENSAGNGIYTLSPSRTLTLGGALATISVISGETLVIPGVVLDSPAGQPLIFNSPGGTLALSGANTYSGGTIVSAGTLSVSSSNNLGAAGSSLTLNGGTLQVAGTNFSNFSGCGHPVTFNSGKAVALDINSSNGIFTADAVLNQGIGGLTKLGSGTLILNQANTFTGGVCINGGVLALAAGGSLSGSASVSLSAGTTFDVSGWGAAATYPLGGSSSLTASGSMAAAIIKGGVNGTVDMNFRPITLNFDGLNPALIIFQGTLNMSGQIVTVNASSPLANGAYNLIQVNSGSISHTSSYILAGTATNGTMGCALNFVTNAGIACLQLVVTGSTNSPVPNLTSDEADAFELYLLNNQSLFPNDFFMAVPGDDASVGNYLTALSAAGKFSDITYPASSTATVVQGGGGWQTHLVRLVEIYQALISTTSAYRLSLHAEVLPKVRLATTAYAHAPWDITDQWNYCHTWADLCEVYALGSVCLYSRQINRLGPGLIPISEIDGWGNRIPDLFRNGHIDTNYLVPPNGVISVDHLPFLWTGANMIWASQGIMLKYLTQSTNSVRLEGLDATFKHIYDGFKLIGPKHESPTGWPDYTAIPQMPLDYMLGEHGTPYANVYGGTYLSGIISWRDQMVNFPRWSLPVTNKTDQLLANCLLDGVAGYYQGFLDRVTSSRDLLGHSPTYNLSSWANGLVNRGYRASELAALINWNNNNPATNVWPFNNRTFTHFYTSDYSSQHFPHHLVTFRGISGRTAGTEYLGGAFPYGRQVFFPLGGSFIYSTGNEYGQVSYSSAARNFMSSCDFTRVPGVTTKTVTDAAFTNAWGRYIYGDLMFAGTVSTGTGGVSGWEQSRYVQSDTARTAMSLSGHVAVFYLDNAVVHLGAGYDNTLDALPTTTSLNQCLSASNSIIFGLNGATQTIPGTGGGITNAGITWALYQGVGYLPPAGGAKILRDVQQNGLERIFSFYVDQSAADTNLCFNWAVLPGVDQAMLASYATNANRSWIIVSNTSSLQALSVPAKAWLGAVFHDTNSTLIANGLTINVSRPTVLVVATQSNQMANLYAADPFENMVAPYRDTNNLVAQITVSINGKPFALALPPKPYLGKTVNATVTLSPTNLPPVIVAPPSAAFAVAGEAATFSVVAVGDPLPTYQWQRNNTNLAGCTAASFSLNPSVADNGASFRCVISNRLGAVTSTPAILSVNDVPLITAVTNQKIYRNTGTLPLTFSVSDLLTPPASLVVTAGSSNPTLLPNANIVLGGSGSNRTVTVTPALNQTGYGTITLTVSDGSLSASSAFLMTVVSTPNTLPPFFPPIQDRTLMAGSSLAIAGSATDPNVPALTLGYSLPTKPAGASLNPASGLVRWRPLIAQGGADYPFTVIATNTAGLMTTQSFLVNVTAPQPPLISAAQHSGGPFAITVSGDPGPDYTVQTATNLFPINWQTSFATNAPLLPFIWTETNKIVMPSSFYRVLLGP